MGLPLRITFNDQDYVYQIMNSNLINKHTTELELVLNGETLHLVKDNTVWKLHGAENPLDPEFVQALGRSVSLRMRM